jgi:membrane-associated phospholipid phosphatase
MFRTSSSSAVVVATAVTAAPLPSSSSSRGQQRSRRHDGGANGAKGVRQDADHGISGITALLSSSSPPSAAAAAAAESGATTTASPRSHSRGRPRALAASSLSAARISSGDVAEEGRNDDNGRGTVLEAGGNRRPVSHFASFSSSVRSASFMTAPIPAPTTGTAVLVRQFVTTLLATLLSWNLPRYLIARETSIAHKPAPYKVIGNDNDNLVVVLNPELHHPLVEPPTIPCTCVFAQAMSVRGSHTFWDRHFRCPHVACTAVYAAGFLVWTSIGAPLLGVLVVGYCTRPVAVRPYSKLPSWDADAVKESNKDRAALSSPSSTWTTWLVTLHSGMCGALTSIALVEGPTQLLKLYVQRPRPNFYALCGFDVQLKKCTAPLDRNRDATFSFPSGHSSLASAGMVYLSYFLLSRIVHAPGTSRSVAGRWLFRYRHTMALLSVLLPYGWCLFVAASRIVDRWHHPGDVLAGLLLGWFGATVSYHYWFPPVWISAVPWSLWLGGSA